MSSDSKDIALVAGITFQVTVNKLVEKIAKGDIEDPSHMLLHSFMMAHGVVLKANKNGVGLTDDTVTEVIEKTYESHKESMSKIVDETLSSTREFLFGG